LKDPLRRPPERPSKRLFDRSKNKDLSPEGIISRIAGGRNKNQLEDRDRYS
jgi:hypothetical protein